MAEPSEPDRLKALEERINAAKGAETPPSKFEEHHSQAHLAWRMVIEMVAGLLIGFGIGFGLDTWLGSAPWFIVVFTLLGFVAGVRVMLRSAQEVQAAQEADRSAGKRE